MSNNDLEALGEAYNVVKTTRDRELKPLLEEIEALKARVAAIKEVHQPSLDDFEAKILDLMMGHGEKRFDGDNSTITLNTSTRITVDDAADMSKWPSELVRVTTEADKRLIRKLITDEQINVVDGELITSDGEKIEGATQSTNYSVTIKR